MEDRPGSTRARPLLELFPPPDYERTVRVPVLLDDHAAPAPSSAPRAALETTARDTLYGATEPPFGDAASDLKFLYHSAEHDRAAEAVLGAVSRRDRLVVLTGEPGVGKTLLLRAVMEQLDNHTLTSHVSERFESSEDLLKTVLVDFGVISRNELARGRLRDASREDLSATLRDFLVSLGPLEAFAVVFIDNAHELPAEIVREVGELVTMEGKGEGKDQALLQVVLVGEPPLLRTLAHSKLKPLATQTAVRCTLGPLAAHEIAPYVAHRLNAADARVEFDARAVARLYRWSRGVPAAVNHLCDRALSVGHAAAATVIDSRLVTSAADDLGLRRPFTKSRAFRVVAWLLLLLALAAAAVAVALFRL